MKILPVEKIREADQYTIQNEPISDLNLMERAASQLFIWFVEHIEEDSNIHIFCGTGNNGGDGLVLSRLLIQKGYIVNTWLVKYSEKLSPSCDANLLRLKNLPGANVEFLTEESKMPGLHKSDIIVDAIFGSGLSRAVKGFAGSVITHINASKAFTVSVDVPSGLFCDHSNLNEDGAVINAAYTLTFQFPKFSFLFAENDKHLGVWEVLPIGLHPEYIVSVDTDNFFIESEFCRLIMRSRHKYDHKGIFGHGLLVGGSAGKMGAAVLASRAALRSGAGLITAHVPKQCCGVLQTALPEAMCSLDENNDHFTALPDISIYNAIAVGPGLGQDKQSANALKLLIQESKNPLIFDADAINILSENKTWLSFIPKNSIFTPHPKEFTRLTGHSSNNFERHEKQIEFSRKYGCYVILKGAHTSITTPEGKAYFNSTGNPGMATGGSGDVLTGILLGLKARGYSALETCLIGVYIHGLAGDIAAEDQGKESLIASDIIENLGDAFLMVKSA